MRGQLMRDARELLALAPVRSWRGASYSEQPPQEASHALYDTAQQAEDAGQQASHSSEEAA